MQPLIRILVLEDNPADFELIHTTLERSGLPCSAIRVETSVAFLSELKTQPPDIVLSDHGLPQFDGIAALKMVRALMPNLPFIFVTGAPGEQAVIECFELGANDYVLKERLDDLAPAIRRALDYRRQLPRGAEHPDIFKCAVEQATDAVVITTAELDLPGPQIIYVNDAFTTMTGYAVEDVIGKTPRLLQGPKTDRQVLDRLKSQLLRGERFEGETYNYRKNGEEFLLQWEIAPLRDRAGNITHFVSVQRDVTQRRRDEALRLEHQRNHARDEAAFLIYETLNRMTDAFVSLDRNWIYTFVNAKAGELFGRRPEDLIGKHIWTEYPEGVGQPFHRTYEKVMAEGRPATIEAYYEPWQRWFENRIYPTPNGICIFFREVTEQRKQREELQASLERFELVMQVTQDVIYDWNIEGGKIRWNQNYYSVFQDNFEVPEEDILAWSNHIHPDDRDAVGRSLTDALQGKATYWQADYRFRRGDGSYADVADRGFIVRNDRGASIRMVGAMVDVSEQKRRNRSLHETARRVTSILESITDAFFSLDREWRFTYVNNQAERLLSKSRDEIIGRNIWDVFPEAAGSQFDREYRRAIHERATVKFEAYEPVRRIWLFVTAYPSPEGLSVYLHDITARKSAEEGFRRSEEERGAIQARHEAIVTSALDAIITIDGESRVQDWNPAAERIFKYKKEEVLGRSMVELIIPPELRESHRRGIEQHLKSGVVPMAGKRYELPALRADGTRFPADISITQIARKGEPLFTGFVRDISERKAAELKLREQEERLRLIVENADDYAIMTLDLESRVTSWNRGAEKIFGYSREEMLGQSCAVVFVPEDLQKQVNRREIETALNSGSAMDERWYLRKGGERFWGNVWIRGLKDETGTVRGFLKILRDDTARLHARAQMERLNEELEGRVRQRTEELETANRELEAFSYSVSHDLRAPLRHIKAFGEMLEESIKPRLHEDERELLAAMTKSAEKMSGLIDDLLSFSRMSRREAILARIPLRNIVDEVVEGFRLETRGRKVQWVKGELPVITGDEAMLRQVFTNLLSNALKYTSTKEQAVIEVGAREEETEHIIYVRDNGVGFDPRHAARLFGVFERLHPEGQFEGTGIGLAIVRKIIERHGGRVWAEGEVDHGATFYFSLRKEGGIQNPAAQTNDI